MAAVSQKEIPRATSQRRDGMAAISTGALIGLGALSAGTQIYGQHKAIGAQQKASREAYAIEDRRAQEAGQLAREQERWNRQMQARREERLNPYRVMAMHSLSNAMCKNGAACTTRPKVVTCLL
jgi:hypothetical protein